MLRRSHISSVSQRVLTIAPGVPSVPKLAVPSFQAEASNSVLVQSGAGWWVVKRHSDAVFFAVGMTSVIVTLGTSGRRAQLPTFAVSARAPLLHIARSGS